MNRRKFLAGTAAGAAGMSRARRRGVRARPGTADDSRRRGEAGKARRPRRRIAGQRPGRQARPRLAHDAELQQHAEVPVDAESEREPDDRHLRSAEEYQDVYGVSHIEFQHGHLVNGGQTPPDAAFFREMRARQDAVKVTCSQVNIEIGQIPNLAGEARAKWMTLGKQWVDAAPIIGVTRLMLNQTGLNEENKANCISVWKEIQDYAKPKGIKISAETRGTGGGGAAAVARADRRRPPHRPPPIRASRRGRRSPCWPR